jgi:hypothetical protein
MTEQLATPLGLSYVSVLDGFADQWQVQVPAKGELEPPIELVSLNRDDRLVGLRFKREWRDPRQGEGSDTYVSTHEYVPRCMA